MTITVEPSQSGQHNPTTSIRQHKPNHLHPPSKVTTTTTTTTNHSKNPSRADAMATTGACGRRRPDPRPPARAGALVARRRGGQREPGRAGSGSGGPLGCGGSEAAGSSGASGIQEQRRVGGLNLVGHHRIDEPDEGRRVDEVRHELRPLGDRPGRDGGARAVAHEEHSVEAAAAAPPRELVRR